SLAADRQSRFGLLGRRRKRRLSARKRMRSISLAADRQSRFGLIGRRRKRRLSARKRMRSISLAADRQSRFGLLGRRRKRRLKRPRGGGEALVSGFAGCAACTPPPRGGTFGRTRSRAAGPSSRRRGR